MNDKEQISNWIAVADGLPEDGDIVETKIADKHLGDWCLIKRRYRSSPLVAETWSAVDPNYQRFNRVEHFPTHWHQI